MELLYLSLKLLRGGHSGRDKHDVGSVDEFAQSPAANVSAVEGFVMSDSLFLCKSMFNLSICNQACKRRQALSQFPQSGLNQVFRM